MFKFWTLFSCFVIFFAKTVNAATITALSPAQGDVRDAIARASTGDIVRVPAGTAQWYTNLFISKAITLQGAGPGNTIIEDYGPSNGILIWIGAVPAKNTRLSGFEFRNGNRSYATFGYNGTVALVGKNNDQGTVRVDNCKFNELWSFAVMVYGAIGVIDHCDFKLNARSVGVYFYNENWDGGSFGDGSWAAPTDWNGTNWMVIESCSMSFTGIVYGVVDSYRGARWVFRYNNVTNGWCEAHGTESGQRFRGTRAVQIYGNKFVADNGGGQQLNLRSGTAVICSNTASGYLHTSVATLACYRSFWKFTPWGGADGTNAWDLNVSTTPLDFGKATGGAAVTLIDSTKNWVPNQWAGFSLQNKRTDRHSLIVGNTSTTITYLQGAYGPDMDFTVGDSYQVWQVLEALDQPGKGKGALLSGDNPSPRWLNEFDEPVYQWANTINGGPAVISSHASFIRKGEHYFDNVPMPGFAPMPYPHPLITGIPGTPSDSPRPNAPTNLRILP